VLERLFVRPCLPQKHGAMQRQSTIKVISPKPKPPGPPPLYGRARPPRVPSPNGNKATQRLHKRRREHPPSVAPRERIPPTILSKFLGLDPFPAPPRPGAPRAESSKVACRELAPGQEAALPGEGCKGNRSIKYAAGARFGVIGGGLRRRPGHPLMLGPRPARRLERLRLLYARAPIRPSCVSNLGGGAWRS